MTPGATTAAVIVADHLSKWFGQVSALNDLSVQVPSGVTGLLGPNGAGKSTFMKAITGQLKPSQGRVTVFGAPIWGHPNAYQRLGFCPEQDGFYETMTGRAWLASLVQLNGLDRSAAVAASEQALELVDLGDAGNKKIAAYSKGMRQRLKLAQAFIHDPDVLVLDEPLSGLDPIGRRKAIRLIRMWGEAGKTVLVSSHVLHEVEAMTSNILLIDHGRVVAEGNVHQIRELIDKHPHSVVIRARDPRALARALVDQADVVSLRVEPDSVVVQTSQPDAFYSRLTRIGAQEDAVEIDEVTSPDDNLQAVFQYLVKS